MSPRRTGVLLVFLLSVILVQMPAEAGLWKHKKDRKTDRGAAQSIKQSMKPMPEGWRAEHVLNRLGYGARPGDIERVERMGVQAWIERQLHPEKIDDSAMETRLGALDTLRMSNQEIAMNYPQLGQAKKVIQAMNSGEPVPRRVRARYERLVQLVPELATVDDPQKLMAQLTPERRRLLLQHSPQRLTAELQEAKLLRAVYSERQLYEQVVDFWMNHFNVYAAKGADRWLITSYERDVIRPHAMGKFQDLLVAVAQSPAMLFYLDNFQSAAPNPYARNERARKRGLNENYARELMELHTLGVDGGYTQKDVTEVARCLTGWTVRRPREGAEFVFNPRMHDEGEKTVLGVRIGAGGGESDGMKVLDILAHHPSTAHFIATKLVRRFVADNPPPALVDRVAETFRQSGGDIRETLRAIFTSPEFFSADVYRAKVKTPFELVASALRASNADVGFSRPLLQTVARLGEPLYLCEPPTGYPDVADAWVNTGLMLNRVNFATTLADGGLPNVVVHPEDVKVPNVAEKTRAAAAEQVDPARRAAVLLGSPEFQRR